MEQRTAEWHNARLGKFTASEIHKLMGVKGLGETGKNYAFEKAIEQLYGLIDENFVSFDMQRGIDLEPLAFNKFSNLKDLEFIQVVPAGFLNLTDYSGASPDGIVGYNDVLEIKCPKSSTFFKLVADGEIDKKYFYQMQHQMMCTGGNKAYFFNYLVHEGVEYWHEIIVPKCEKTCDLILDRILEAAEIKQEYIEKINNNKQF